MTIHLRIVYTPYQGGVDAAEYAIGNQVELALRETGGDRAAALPMLEDHLLLALVRFLQAQNAIMSSDTRQWLNGFTDAIRDALDHPERWIAA